MSFHTVKTLVLGCLFVAICCVTQPISESKAAGEKGDELTRQERWRRIESSEAQMRGTTTRVTVVGNAVMVPVTVEHSGTEVEVLLLLDTGSSRTVVSADIASRLNINLSDAGKTRAQVVGGALIEARRVRLNAITVGPHTIKNVDVFVVEHIGPPVKHDGLLGMDLLRGLKYNIDFQKQAITWE